MKPDTDYDLSKRFLIFMDKYLHHRDEKEISNSLSYKISSLEERGASIAKSGVKMAISDILSETSPFNQDMIRKIDSNLSQNSLPTLSSMRVRYWKRYKSIIKRGKIQGLIEYYAIKAIFEDTDEGTSEERDAMRRMLSDYEHI
jgi:hypothetical protein